MAERVFTVARSTATPATPISLADAGLRERSDLQEWILANPAILGPDILVVTFEFDGWWAATGRRERHRLDVLGLDQQGRLVIAELKRDRAPETVDMQAIKYAAMASRFSEPTLVEQHAKFLARTGRPASEKLARQRLVAHAGHLAVTELRRPRIVLVAGSFPPIVTTTAAWLSDMGLDITLQQVQAYRVFEDRIIMTVSQLFPIPNVDKFVISPVRQDDMPIREHPRHTRKKSTVLRLVSTGLLPDGTQLWLRPTQDVDAQIRTAVRAWLNENPARGRATWLNDIRAPLKWAADGNRYGPTEVIRLILQEAVGIERTLRATSWWIREDGLDLPTLAAIGERTATD